MLVINADGDACRNIADLDLTRPAGPRFEQAILVVWVRVPLTLGLRDNAYCGSSDSQTRSFILFYRRARSYPELSHYKPWELGLNSAHCLSDNR